MVHELPRVVLVPVGGAFSPLGPFGIAFPYLTKKFVLGQASKVFPLRFGSGRFLSLDYWGRLGERFIPAPAGKLKLE